MLKILSIGNRFSEDAQRYLHGIAESFGKLGFLVTFLNCVIHNRTLLNVYFVYKRNNLSIGYYRIKLNRIAAVDNEL